jgi:hypothetical protein
MENMFADSVKRDDKNSLRNTMKSTSTPLKDGNGSRNSPMKLNLTSKSGRKESKIPIPSFSSKLKAHNMSWESINNKNENINPRNKSTAYNKYKELRISNEEDNITISK